MTRTTPLREDEKILFGETVRREQWTKPIDTFLAKGREWVKKKA